MKKLNAIHFSAARELTKGEQKNLKGGTDGLIYACICQCTDSIGVWKVYTSNGECPNYGPTSSNCGGDGSYTCQ